jgi:hypothetical protein
MLAKLNPAAHSALGARRAWRKTTATRTLLARAAPPEPAGFPALDVALAAASFSSALSQSDAGAATSSALPPPSLPAASAAAAPTKADDDNDEPPSTSADAPVPPDVLREFEHKLEADVKTVATTLTAVTGVIVYWRGVWSLIDHTIGDTVFGDVCCIFVGLSIVLWIRVSGVKVAPTFWPPS